MDCGCSGGSVDDIDGGGLLGGSAGGGRKCGAVVRMVRLSPGPHDGSGLFWKMIPNLNSLREHAEHAI